MKIVGLTGGIASGKSTVSQLLREAAIPVIDADRVAHDALLRGTLCYRLVVSRFGPHILDTSTLEVDRAKLGTIVFSDGAARKQLNGIMLPWIGLGLFFQVAFYFSAGAPVVVIDAPLLFETRLDAACSLNVVVSVDKETQLRRLVGRDAQGEAEARRRIAAQPLSLAQKAARADVVIDNSQGLDALRANVER
ncbi:dephospho-CoA kinase, partial [Pelagophyceae sp. CCMP2097]